MCGNAVSAIPGGAFTKFENRRSLDETHCTLSVRCFACCSPMVGCKKEETKPRRLPPPATPTRRPTTHAAPAERREVS